MPPGTAGLSQQLTLCPDPHVLGSDAQLGGDAGCVSIAASDMASRLPEPASGTPLLDVTEPQLVTTSPPKKKRANERIPCPMPSGKATWKLVVLPKRAITRPPLDERLERSGRCSRAPCVTARPARTSPLRAVVGPFGRRSR